MSEPTKADPNEGYLTVREAAKFLCLTENGIRCAMAQGRLPYLKWGRRCFISREDLVRGLKRVR